MTASLKIPKEADKIDKAESEVVIWSDDELGKIYKGLDYVKKSFRLRFLIILLANTGVRISEALAVSVNDIDEEGLHIRRQLREQRCNEKWLSCRAG